MLSFDRLMVCDIDNTLIGNRSSLKRLFQMIKSSPIKIAFGVATGRNLKLIYEVLEEWNIPQPNFFISSVGSELFYGKEMQFNCEWKQWLNYRWNAEKVKEALSSHKDLTLQQKDRQNFYKVSYYIDEESTLDTKEIKKILHERDISCNVIKSHGILLDVLPVRCSKGLALHYFVDKWKLSLDHVLVAGDSGNDISMLCGEVLGVIVGNHSPEVEILRGEPRVFFAPGKFAQGIIDGIEHYNFLGDIKPDPLNEG